MPLAKRPAVVSCPSGLATIFPPSDGYQPLEDPPVGVARQIHAAKTCKEAVPGVPMVGSGYSHLQDYLSHVAQAVVRAGWIDSIGLGWIVLVYSEMPADTLADGSPDRKRMCQTFSDYTTGPRHGLWSGCFPLDLYYKNRSTNLNKSARSSCDARTWTNGRCETKSTPVATITRDEPVSDFDKLQRFVRFGASSCA